MRPDYSDITKRLGPPLWWDEYGVPRYDPFKPSMCDVYVKKVALLIVKCQECGREFKVAVSTAFSFYEPTPNKYSWCFYGDPPRHDDKDCPAGNTMNSIPVQVLEYWERGSSGHMCWRRRPEYECVFTEEAE
ncbi:hypothetical protein kuro4_00850 [Gelria sp. Kuro-4]|nr:hypothetical protein kuro4_00850 [Gelria sp. Kuro-4]